MRPVPIGQLRTRLQVERASENTTAAAARSVTWSTIGTVMGSVVGLNATEQLHAAQARAKVSHKITIRWFDGLTTKDRLLHAETGRVWNILSVSDRFERRRYMDLVVLEIEGVTV